jgi:hypothetical protein
MQFFITLFSGTKNGTPSVLSFNDIVWYRINTYVDVLTGESCSHQWHVHLSMLFLSRTYLTNETSDG